MTVPNDDRNDRSLGSLFSELTREFSTLFRNEVDLAKAEVTQKVSRLGSGAGEVAVGGAILFIAIQALIAAAILLLAKYIDPWLSALVVGIFVLLVGIVVLKVGLANFRAENLKPQRTIDSLKDNKDWAKEQLR